MICKTGLKNMVRPNTLMVKGCMVQCWRPLIELNTVNYSEMVKMKNLPLLVPQKDRDSCQLYRVTRIAIHR